MVDDKIGKVFKVETTDSNIMTYRIIEYIPDLYKYCKDNNIDAFDREEFHNIDGYKYTPLKNKYRSLFTYDNVLLPYCLCTTKSPVGNDGVLDDRWDIEQDIKEVIEGE